MTAIPNHAEAPGQTVETEEPQSSAPEREALHAEAAEALTDDAFAEAEAAQSETETDPAAAAPTRGPAVKPGPVDETLAIRGRKLALRRFSGGAADAGAAQAVLAHGSAEHAGRWTALAQAMAGRLSLVALDLPGYGRSDPPPADGHPVFVHDAAALSQLTASAPGRVHLVGAGPGAEAATRTALRHPEKIASLALIEPAAFALLEEAEDPRRLEALDLALGVGALVSYGENAAAARLLVDFWGGDGAFEALDEEAQAYAAASAERAAAELRAISRHTPGALLFEDYRRIEAPMLVIYGARARPSVRASAARIRRAAAFARSVELPDARASIDRTATDRAVIGFIEERLRQDAEEEARRKTAGGA